MGPRRWSRGRARRSGAEDHDRQASMGPRRWSRGRGRSFAEASESYPCFNGATAMEPWKRIPAAILRPILDQLQWGHGDGAVEEFGAARRSPGRSRFNGATAMEPWKRSASASASASIASMGPRRWSRGRGRASGTCLWSRRLQWGHGDGAVEESPPSGPFGAKDLGPGLREGRPAGVSNRSRAPEMKS